MKTDKGGMNYGVIGNCQVAALIDDQARLVWACLPRPDGDPVFSALLQKDGGASENGLCVNSRRIRFSFSSSRWTSARNHGCKSGGDMAANHICQSSFQ